MAFSEVRLPEDISLGAEGGPGYKTTINTTDGGLVHRISRWSAPRHRYNIAYGVRTRTQLGLLKSFYMAVDGGAVGFRFKDWVDYTTAADGASAYSATDQICVKLSATRYQLRKAYTAGSRTLWRTITKPVAGRVIVAVDGVVAATQPALDDTTGVLTFASDQGSSTITWGGEFDVPVVFDEAVDDMLALTVRDREVFAADSIELVELPPENSVSFEDFPMRGSYEATLTGAISLTLTALLWDLTPGGADRDVELPVITNAFAWPGGGPYFVVHNAGSSGYGLKIRHDGTEITTIHDDGTAHIYLTNDGVDYTWRVIG